MVQRTVTNMAEPALVEGIGFVQPTENPAQTFQHLKGAQRGEGSRNSTESLNHRILEYWGWKGPSFLHSKPSATGKDTFPRPGLNTGTAHPEKCPNNPHWRYSKLRFRGSQVTQPKVPSSLDFPSTLCSSASDFHFSAWDLLFICLWFFFFLPVIFIPQRPTWDTQQTQKCMINGQIDFSSWDVAGSSKPMEKGVVTPAPVLSMLQPQRSCTATGNSMWSTTPDISDLRMRHFSSQMAKPPKL